MMKKLLIVAVALASFAHSAHAFNRYNNVLISTATAITPPFQIGNVNFSSGTIGPMVITSSVSISSGLGMDSNKITNLANGSASTDGAAFGQIFDGFQTQKQTTLLTSSATASSTYVRTGLSVTITPTSSSNRIKINISCSLRTSNPTTDNAYATLERNGSNIIATNGFTDFAGSGTNPIMTFFGFTYIDSPASTSALTYEVYIHTDGGGGTVTLNVASNTCTIIADEIQ